MKPKTIKTTFRKPTAQRKRKSKERAKEKRNEFLFNTHISKSSWKLLLCDMVSLGKRCKLCKAFNIIKVDKKYYFKEKYLWIQRTTISYAAVRFHNFNHNSNWFSSFSLYIFCFQLLFAEIFIAKLSNILFKWSRFENMKTGIINTKERLSIESSTYFEFVFSSKYQNCHLNVLQTYYFIWISIRLMLLEMKIHFQFVV